jgi:NADH-quinone oxidoreductase subunit C
MNNVDYISNLVENSYKIIRKEVVNKNQVSFIVENDQIHSLLTFLKTNGWKQLSYLSAVDWIDQNQLELVYIVFNWEKPVYIQVRTMLDREHPEMASILPIFPGCKYYERETHEFFGIKFPGNPDHEKQLILEEWDDMPPLLKDFDPRAYSDKKFAKREYTEDFVNLNGQESKQKVREERKTNIIKVRKGGRK